MQAQLEANIAPWLPQPVIDAKADLQNVDLARLWPEAPATLAERQGRGRPRCRQHRRATVWQASADIRNALPGPWDTGKLPVEQVEARASFDGTNWTLPEATVRAGGGPHRGRGPLEPRARALAGARHACAACSPARCTRNSPARP